jgi:hypothetical protein
MNSLYVEKPEITVTFQDLTFVVKSYYCNIAQRIMIYTSMTKTFINEGQGIYPFELKLKGYFEAHTPLNLPAIYTILNTNPVLTLYLKNTKFSLVRLKEITVSEDMSKQFAECELTFLVAGVVTAE